MYYLKVIFIFMLFIFGVNNTSFANKTKIISNIYTSQFEVQYGSGKLTKSVKNFPHLAFRTAGDRSSNLVILKRKFKNLKSSYLRFRVKINNMNNFKGLEFRFGKSSNFDNKLKYAYPYYDDYNANFIQEGDWHNYTISGGDFFKNNKSVDSKDLNYFGIFISDNGKGPVEVKVSDIEVVESNNPAIVSITFDDGYKTHFKIAELMNQYEMSGTAYVMPRSVKNNTSLYLNFKELKTMHDVYGWGISAHHNTPYVFFSLKELEKEIQYTVEFLEKQGFNKSSRHLAYPLGKSNRKGVLNLVRKQYSTARNFAGGPETLPPADEHLIRAINVINTTSPEEIEEYVKNAVENKQWLVLVFHKFKHNPKGPMEYSYYNFKKILEIIKRSKVKVMPVHKVFDQYLQKSSLKFKPDSMLFWRQLKRPKIFWYK